MSNSAETSISLRIPFPSKRHAEIAFDALRVDSEPHRSFVRKTLKLDDQYLLLDLVGEQSKNLRVALTSFLESLILCCETLEQFGPPVSEQYSHY
ncbi:EKC/KEOPS complex subunit Lage3-like [Anopheles albimanus]|uniref:EKC/KEOPS complex subunit Lage3-like n=1 Tax=Anopheles albimanus TaxID=7167 RepID=UPI00163EADE0|nr:EKC/KEOPS complex subunit Lage3-like [Anopheles albimanus]